MVRDNRKENLANLSKSDLVRKLQIEAALDVVRNRTLDMRDSSELAETSQLLFDQITGLGIKPRSCGFLIMNEETETMQDWSTNVGEHTSSVLVEGTLTFNQHPILEGVVETWRRGDPYFIGEVHGEEYRKYYDAVTAQEIASKEIKEKVLATASSEYTNSFYFGYGMMYVLTHEPLSDFEINMLLRFAGVFKLTYRRFLDLKNAEALAREARMEAALERVRSRTISMQSSNELSDAAVVLFRELNQLNVESLWMSGFALCEKDRQEDEFWLSTESGEMTTMFIPNNVDPAHKKMYQGWLDGLEFLSFRLEGQELDEHYAYLKTIPEPRKDFAEMEAQGQNLPDFQELHCIYFSHGYLLIVTLEPFDGKEIFQRFGNVFEQTYTRFLDLQRSEAQAREAKIETALERVRSRTMGMQSSDELPEAANLLFQQVQSLGMPAWSAGYCIWDEDKNGITLWMSSEGVLQPPFRAPLNEDPAFISFYEAYQSGDTFSAIEMGGEELVSHYRYMRNLPVVGEILDSIIDAGFPLPTYQIFHLAFFSHGFLLFITYEPVPEAWDIFKRFGKVFEQTYTRFLDLQKAEAQAREAQIQAALERIRARAMAMHHTDELSEVLSVVFQQFDVLGIGPMHCTLTIFDEEANSASFRMTGRAGKRFIAEQQIDLDAMDEWKEMVLQWKKKEPNSIHNPFYPPELLPKVWDVFDEILSKLPEDARIYPEDFPDGMYFCEGNYDHGYIGFCHTRPYTEEEKDIVLKFATEFGRLYTRFLDLQNKQKQAREAEIEAALEKVRGKALAMHKKEDFQAAAHEIFVVLRELGIAPIRSGLSVVTDPETMAWEAWSITEGADGILIELSSAFTSAVHSVSQTIFEHWQAQDPYWQINLSGEGLQDFVKSMPREYVPVHALWGKLIEEQKSVIFHYFSFAEGVVFAGATHPFSEEEIGIMKRFTAVFAFAYTRYVELQKAETQAREATKQASLERIRGQVASMRSAEDLDRIIPLLWQELVNLNIPFLRCGVFIMDEMHSVIEAHLSAPDGHSLGVLHLQFNSNTLTRNAVEHWKRNNIYREHWGKEEFVEWMNSMIAQGQIANPDKYRDNAAPPESLYLHFIPFEQGMIYVGNPEQLTEDYTELVRAMAETFAIAYARYEDFIKLEKAKQNVESTLAELKTTQAQLIQSEKMASLGELTAGIAHEIQNPLNFVNNFSEVNKELLEELSAEIESGNYDEARAIAMDLIDNESKITHHGKRAEGIVKGMLMHSRSGTGEKVLTDINALADEYLRLAYHGLRARDKSFNARMQTDFDPEAGALEVVPQEFGRVLLNLITNAFHAVCERSNESDESFTPEVTVCTKKTGNRMSISVADNGNGIPPAILDKIFQPFFSTKPTGQGTGLGLSLSYDIVQAHGGELSVKSVEKQGATFIISLPV